MNRAGAESERPGAAAPMVDEAGRTLLRGVIDAIPQGIALWNRHGCLSAWNERFLAFTGLTRREVWTGRRAEEIARALGRRRTPDEDAVEAFARDLVSRLASGRHNAFEEIADDGRILEVRQSPLPGGEMLVSYTDVSERRRAESALVRSEMRYRGVVDTQNELVCRFDPDGWLTFVNQAFCRYLGRRRSHLLGRSVFTLGGEGIAEALRRPLADLRAGRVREAQIVTQIATPGDGDTWQEWTAQAIRCEDDTHEFQLVGRDVSELKAAQREAVQLAKMASLGQVVAGMAHELNQPLNTIAMAADNALMTCESGEIDPAYVTAKLRTVHDHAMRMGEIIRYLRAFNRPEPGEVEVVSLAGVVDRGLRLAARELEIHGIALSRSFAEQAAHVRCNPVALQQVLLNLLTNARDAILERRRHEPDAPAHIEVEVAAGREGRATVRVRDSGRGVPESIRERIFDPLFTTKTLSGREGGEGLGLGLAICYRSVIQMGGQIDVMNVVEGAEFRVDLPVTPMHPEAGEHG